jgi:hypothetical protein
MMKHEETYFYVKPFQPTGPLTQWLKTRREIFAGTVPLDGLQIAPDKPYKPSPGGDVGIPDGERQFAGPFISSLLSVETSPAQITVRGRYSCLYDPATDLTTCKKEEPKP